jgi:hypothetical protein
VPNAASGFQELLRGSAVDEEATVVIGKDEVGISYLKVAEASGLQCVVRARIKA